MSKGSQIVTLRPGDALLTEMDQAITAMNITRTEEPFTRSSWIITAIREKLAKRQRSNRSRAGRRGPSAESIGRAGSEGRG